MRNSKPVWNRAAGVLAAASVIAAAAPAATAATPAKGFVISQNDHRNDVVRVTGAPAGLEGGLDIAGVTYRLDSAHARLTATVRFVNPEDLDAPGRTNVFDLSVGAGRNRWATVNFDGGKATWTVTTPKSMREVDCSGAKLRVTADQVVLSAPTRCLALSGATNVNMSVGVLVEDSATGTGFALDFTPGTRKVELAK